MPARGVLLNMNSTLLRLGALTVIAVVAWISAFAWHRVIQGSAQEAIRAPRPIAILFGCLRSDGLLDYRGVLLQLCIYVTVPVFALMILGEISQKTALSWLSWPLIVLFVLAVIFALKRGR